MLKMNIKRLIQPQKLNSIPYAKDEHKMKPVLKIKDLTKLTTEDIKFLNELSVDIPHIISENKSETSESVS